MKNIITLLFAIVCGVSFADPATNQADLKAQQNPITLTHLLDISDAQADKLVFKDCTFGYPSYTAQGGGMNIGSASHYVTATGTLTADISISYNNGGGAIAAYLKGSISTLILSQETGNDVSGDGGVTINGATAYVSGIVSRLDATSVTANPSYNGNMNVLLSQTGSITCNLTVSDSSLSITGTNITSFTATTCAVGGIQNSCQFVLDLPSTTYADVSTYGGSQGLGNGVLNFGCDPIISSSIGVQYDGEAWSGPFSRPFVNALLTSWFNGGTAGSYLVIGGTSASPSPVVAEVDHITITGTVNENDTVSTFNGGLYANFVFDSTVLFSSSGYDSGSTNWIIGTMGSPTKTQIATFVSASLNTVGWSTTSSGTLVTVTCAHPDTWMSLGSYNTFNNNFGFSTTQTGTDGVGKLLYLQGNTVTTN